jgi:hypothetical protein
VIFGSCTASFHMIFTLPWIFVHRVDNTFVGKNQT